MKEPLSRILLNPITHTIRAAQTVLQYGVGAMVDFPDQTLMTAAPEYWDDKIIKIHDERLSKALRVDYFGMPGGKDFFPEGISYVRFPRWYFCPQCRRFRRLEVWEKEYQRKRVKSHRGFDSDTMKRPVCLICKRDLVVARIIVVCENGHIDDFPWIQWTHYRNKGGRKDICNNPDLKFKTGSSSSAGLEGVEVHCETCRSKASLMGSFDRQEGKTAMEQLGSGYKCTGFHPWRNNKESCSLYPRSIQRGASSVYFPKVASSLVIPPYSNEINTKVEQSKEYQKCLHRVEDFDEDEREKRIRKMLDEWASRIGKQIAASKEQVKEVLTRRWLEHDDSCYTTESKDYRLEEYRALTGNMPDSDLKSNDFIREERDASSYDIPGIKSVSLIHKVREVRALTGFTRLNPPGSSDLGKDDSRFVPIKREQTRWYPAYEVRGEGIFIEFYASEISDWMDKRQGVRGRAAILSSKHSVNSQSHASPDKITPSFLFLHSVAHMLIRQLSFECGYTSASLRERVYSGKVKNEHMSGLLIYTASGDSEGTLGGLVRQGYADSLPRVLSQAVKATRVCSNDPVCILSTGQGREALNLAACHTCLLLPETSCEEFNIFLDRALIVGTWNDPQLGFWGEWDI